LNKYNESLAFEEYIKETTKYHRDPKLFNIININNLTIKKFQDFYKNDRILKCLKTNVCRKFILFIKIILFF
jgi:hypothetical protein